jgi:hypothetical protein
MAVLLLAAFLLLGLIAFDTTTTTTAAATTTAPALLTITLALIVGAGLTICCELRAVISVSIVRIACIGGLVELGCRSGVEIHNRLRTETWRCG